MVLIVCAVYDRAAAAYMPPFFLPSAGQAIRGFQDELNRADPGNTMQKHPKDFDLFKLGTFNDATGKFELLGEPEVLALGGQMQLKL